MKNTYTTSLLYIQYIDVDHPDEPIITQLVNDLLYIPAQQSIINIGTPTDKYNYNHEKTRFIVTSIENDVNMNVGYINPHVQTKESNDHIATIIKIYLKQQNKRQL